MFYLQPPLKIMSLPLTLHRSDGVNPPDDWSVNHKNPNRTKDPNIPEKNPAGLFFFSDSIDIAHAYSALSKEYYLTKCKAEVFKFIDFSYCRSPFEMIKVLLSLEINIFIDELHLWEGKNIKAQTFKNRFEEAFYILEECVSKNVDMNERINRFQQANGQVNYLTMQDGPEVSVGVFGQMLTDFDNGFVFKEILKEKNIDGYRWREFSDPRGTTYCFCDSKKLSKPEKQKFQN